MHSFCNHRLRDHALPMSTAWLLNDIAEAKGKQELFTKQSPQLLKALLEMRWPPCSDSVPPAFVLSRPVFYEARHSARDAGQGITPI